MKHIMTRDEAVVAAQLLSNFTNRLEGHIDTMWRQMPIEKRIAAADRLQKALSMMLDTNPDYFMVEAK